MMKSYLAAVYMLGVLACSHSQDAGPDASGCPTDPAQCPDATSTGACSTDGDCSSRVCGSAGACVAEDNVVYAAPTGSDAAPCTKADPCSITHAFAIAAAPRDTIKLEPGSYTASIEVNIASGMSITVHGFGATWNAPIGGHPLMLRSGDLRVEGVSFVDPTANPYDPNRGSIACSLRGGSRTLVLDRVSIEAADQPIMAIGCATSIVRSSIRSHGTGSIGSALSSMSIDRTLVDGGSGISSGSSDVRITNSVITNQSFDALHSYGFLEGGPGRISASFTTIINSKMVCPWVVPYGAVSISNSIVLNQLSGAPADTITGGPYCAIRYTTVFPQSTPLTGDQNKLGIDPLLRDPANGDYHLTPASPAVGAAGETGTPDFDGIARPQGAQSDMGAFELVP